MQFFTLKSKTMSIIVSDFGARIVQWQVLVNNSPRNIVLSYQNHKDYLSDPFYFGAIAGPYANRIRNGRVLLSNQAVQLAENDGENHLHGGPNALDKQHWQLIQADDQTVRLTLCCEDGWNGYPGPMTFEVVYRLEKNTLQLQIHVSSLKDTIVGATGHAYFNLNSADSGISGLCQWLQSTATHFTPKSHKGLPYSENQSVAGTPFDFHRPIFLASSAMYAELDQNFVFNNVTNQTILSSENKDMSLVVTSDYPSAQFYSGSFLKDNFSANQGVCIEPHFGADAPNDAEHPKGILKANEKQTNYINYEVVVGPTLNSSL